ncbi:MAG: hypothetical protein U0324_10400 [Polyangiales bacterium]
MRTRPSAALPFVTALTAAGCFGEPPADDVGSALAEVQSVPAGVGCLRVVYRAPNATADTTRNFAVAPGAAASFDLGYLAAGAYAFRSSAFNVACGSVAAGTVATWVGEAVSATITPGVLTRLALTLRPNVTTPGTVDFVQPVRAIFSGPESYATYALMQDGSVRAWGLNDQGQLGDGTTANARAPRTIAGLVNATQVAAGQRYACATTANGLACWGNFGGLLADDGSGTSLVPRTNFDVEPIAIATGRQTMCGNFGSDWHCWTTVANINTSVTFEAQGVVLTSTSFPSDRAANDALVLDPNAYLKVYATLGDGLWSVPLGQCTAVAAAQESYCAVVAGGNVYCAGSALMGEAGNGSSGVTPLNAPTRAAITQVTAITAGAFHFCALRRDRTVSCWGMNHGGQVGADVYGATVATPATVPLSDVVQVAAGAYHTCALKADGTVWCWGRNEYGQLGDGTNVARFAPVRVQL